MTPEMRALLEWIRDNAWRESRALSSRPMWQVPMVDLLYKIVETHKLDQNEVADIVNWR